MSESDRPASSSGEPGFRFNKVMGEEPAQKVLVPQIDAAARRQRLLFIGLAALAIAMLFLVVFLRTPREAPVDESKSFRPDIDSRALPR